MADNQRKAKIVVSPAESINTAKFVPGDFINAVHTHGYNIYLDKAMRCPCVSSIAGSALLTCQNCGGLGWFFFNRKKTKMIAQSINYSTQYKEWSEENRGTIKLTSTNEDRLSFMDKITVLDGRSIFNQILNCNVSGKELFTFLTYEPTEIIDVFLFESENKPLVKIKDYSFDKNIFKIKNDNFVNKTISIRYEHHPQYCIIDINRDLMVVNPGTTLNSVNCDENGKLKPLNQMPVSAIGRRLHYLLEIPNPINEKLIDNSYE